MSLAAGLPPPTYYEELANELDTIAEAVRKNPELNHHFAERLHLLSKQLREDTRLMRLSKRPVD
ncbi:MAG TPA: hypothetical protein VNH44_02295 [Micropepsaceae bacterium]|nr:hypothetical protein [Micropepsaceae bacterium]